MSLGSVGCFAKTQPSIGFWYQAGAAVMPPHVVERFGGPLEPAEVETIERVSVEELRRAFAGVPVGINAKAKSVWRLSVRPAIARGNGLPASGESAHFGIFGGSGSVDFSVLAANAVHHAADGTSREDIVTAIGRGVGRAAAHEIAHQMLGRAMAEDRIDRDSYEYFSADRRSQYYGELHWGQARELMLRKLGGS